VRRLLYVPLIHDEADMGSVGNALGQRSTESFSKQRWAIHSEVMNKFWESVAAHLRTLDPHRLKIYQDGLPSDGPTGRQIVEEAARRGSKNYRLVLELLDRGAELRKAEDPGLLLQERRNILQLVDQPGHRQTSREAQQYRRQRDHLMMERDKFIAAAINATLKEAEIGVLFLGAFHEVTGQLANDISVEALKDRQRVRAYFEELLLSRDDERFQQLSHYLTSPVD